MHLPLSRAIAGRIDVLPEIGSTNAELVARASAGHGASDEPDFSVLVTDNQTAGRGRLGRSWVAPPGTTIAVSVLLRPAVDPAVGWGSRGLGWLPLLAGLAMTRAVESIVGGHEVLLKWPNDVLIDGLKASGILAELLPTGDAVVIGAGLNLTMSAAELPVPTATSLTLNGVSPDEIADRALSAYLRELRALYDPFTEAGLDAAASGLSAAVTRACGTIGRSVRVELPDGSSLYGRAESLDALGRLVVSPPDGPSQPVAAGDVTHLRYE
jgi:BirA family biotin operon repressor/biotin-[acetyl-CoA-carboxylase] ligase